MVGSGVQEGTELAGEGEVFKMFRYNNTSVQKTRACSFFLWNVKYKVTWMDTRAKNKSLFPADGLELSPLAMER
jgi:hypothetical protein